MTFLGQIYTSPTEFKTNCKHNATIQNVEFPLLVHVPVSSWLAGNALFHIISAWLTPFFLHFHALGFIQSPVSCCRNQDDIGPCETAVLPWVCPSPSLYLCWPSARETSMVSDTLWGSYQVPTCNIQPFSSPFYPLVFFVILFKL